MELCSYFDVRMDPTMGFRTAREGLSAINYFLMHRYSWIPPPPAIWRLPGVSSGREKTYAVSGISEHDLSAIT